MNRLSVRCLIVPVVLLSLSAPARCANDWASAASSSGTAGLLALGIGLSLFTDGAWGQDHSIRTLDAMVTSGLAAEGLERLARERRPDGSDLNSFPSTHAAACFAVAAMESRFHPGQAVYWYSAASVIGFSRVKLRKHTFIDVLAGAGLGFATAAWESGTSHGLLAAPFTRQTSHGLVFAFSQTL